MNRPIGVVSKPNPPTLKRPSDDELARPSEAQVPFQTEYAEQSPSERVKINLEAGHFPLGGLP